MFQTFRPLLIALALGLSAAATQAAPIVPTGSTYDFALRGQVSGYTGVGGVVFDGVAHAFTRTLWDGRTLQMTINESQQDLGGGQYRILIDLVADGDIFPYQGPIGQLANDREYGYLGLGVAGDALNLFTGVRLDSAIYRVFNGAGTMLADSDLAGFVQNRDPWDGTVPKQGYVVGYNNLGNVDARHLQLDMVVSSLRVPEPGALALASLGLLGLVATRRRRS